MELVNCFSTLGCPQLSLRQAIKLAQDHDMAKVEIRAVSGSTDLPLALSGEFGRPEALAEYLAASGIAVPVLGSSHRLFAAAFDLAELQKLAEWADAAGAAFLRVFDGDCETLGASHFDAAQARLEQWETMRVERGFKVRLAIETHGVLCADTALSAFCTRFPDVAVLWDTHHTWAAGNDLAHTRDIIGPRLAHLHVKDSRMIDGRRSYVLPGQGAFPAATLGELLSEEPLSAPAVSLEWELLWYPELADLDTALNSARSWV